MGNRLAYLSYLGVVGLALAASTGVARACTGTNPITCTGSSNGASVTVTAGSFSTPHTVTGSPFPATLVVSGAPGGSTVSGVTVTLHTYSAAGPLGNANGSADVGVLLASPSGHSLQIMRWLGRGSNSQSATITLQDGGTVIPGGDGNSTAWTPANPSTWAPTTYDDTSRDGEASPNYGVTINHSSGTFANAFTGDAVNGTWNLYLADDGVTNGASISFTSWDITITFTAASTPSTTTLNPNPSTVFTSGANSTETLTATVTSGATGTVTFKDGANNLTCSGGNPATLSASSATCSTTFSTEGIHGLTATYSGDGTFVASSGSANIFAQNHATNVSTTYCNAGAINNNGASNLAYSNTSPYPTVIFVGDGTNTDITNSVSTVSVQLKSLSSLGSTDMHMLLVAPDGTHAFDFWSNAGAGGLNGTGDYTLIDGSPQLSPNSQISPGTYGPTTYGSPDSFTPGPPVPAPQVPGSFSSAAPAGTKTFETAFVGATAHGAWKLYLFNGTGVGETTSASGGWCLDITPATGTPTTTGVTPNPTFAALGQPVTFTATVTGGVGSVGTVTFTENGGPLVGAPNGGVSSVSGGQASTTTSSLPEGDHTITALYHDSTNTFNDSFGTTSMRVDKVTSTPTLNSTTWSYCNSGVITIPAGTVTVNDFGPATPNPSNIFVTNLPGTISTVGVTLKGLHLAHGGNDLESLLVGPNAANLDFFSLVGNNTTIPAQDTTFEDGISPLPCPTTGSTPPTTNGPTSCGSTSYTPSLFYSLPSIFQHAGPQGAFTFNTGTLTPTSGGVYSNTIPNGTWSLYFDQPQHDTGSGLNSGWCMNFTENPVTVTPTKAHIGPAPSNHFRQGGTGQFTISIQNNGPGPTGDPDQSDLNALTVTDVLASDFTPGTLPTGTPWNCTSVSQTVTCKNKSSVDQGNSYATLTIPVLVAGNAGASDNNSASVSGGGITPTSSNTDTVTIDPAPILAISKSHTGTFTQGSTAVWTLQVSNTSATAAGATDGSTVTVSDTLPTGETLSSFTGTGWSCLGTSTVTCTSNAVIAGNGGTFPLISLTVNVPANSPTSVSNTAGVFGGGDLNHKTLGTAAVSNTDNVTVVQVPASISINGNATQSATINTAFGSLAVTVKDAGGVVIPNYSSVIFLAPATGQSGKFGNNTNTTSPNTNGSGIADPGTFTANGNVGSYTLSVTAGSATTQFNLTNATGPSVVSYSVLFGATSFNLIGSTRTRVPWQIRGITVVFSKSIASGDINSLTGVTTTGFSGLGTNALTWNFSPISIGSFSTVLHASGADALKDASGNALNNGTDFTQALKVLWGDFNDDGVVNASDLTLVNNARLQPYNIFADMNGNGTVDSADVNIVRMRIGTHLP